MFVSLKIRSLLLIALESLLAGDSTDILGDVGACVNLVMDIYIMFSSVEF